MEDLRESTPLDVHRLLEVGLQSYAGVPIIHKGHTLGTLSLFDTTPRPASGIDYDLLIAIGQQIGVAVENTRLSSERTCHF